MISHVEDVQNAFPLGGFMRTCGALGARALDNKGCKGSHIAPEVRASDSSSPCGKAHLEKINEGPAWTSYTWQVCVSWYFLLPASGRQKQVHTHTHTHRHLSCHSSASVCVCVRRLPCFFMGTCARGHWPNPRRSYAGNPPNHHTRVVFTMMMGF